jgi:phosphate:Na+ symporter
MDASLTLVDLAGSMPGAVGVHIGAERIQRAFGPHLLRFLSRILRAPAGVSGRARDHGVAEQHRDRADGVELCRRWGSSIWCRPAAMLGANVGTILIVQLLSFDIGRVAPLFVLVGVVLFRRSFGSRRRDLGRVAIGLGADAVCLAAAAGAADAFEDVPNLRLLMGSVATQPVIDVIIGAAMSWAAHSSVATVLLTPPLAAHAARPRMTARIRPC